MTSLVLLIVIGLSAQVANHADEVNRRLGRGVNIGNTFEAPSQDAWGNPWNPAYLQKIAALGFTHVRVPIRWEPAARSQATAPYTIYPEFLAQVKSIVDEALRHKLHIIINMHHHEALIANPAGQKERFLAQWRQIGEYFKAYPDSLLFEVLNEPNASMTPALWNQYAADGLAEIRKTNPDRVVLIGTAEWGGIGGLSKLQLPNDKNIMVTIHYYNPFEFTHQGADWSDMENVKNVKWHDSEAERETVRQEFQAVQDFARKHQVPIHIGEFGAYSKADMDSRARWTTFLARWFEEQGFSWAYWEFSAGFGIYNPATDSFVSPLVDALLHNPLPKPAETEAAAVYTSRFQSGTDGWGIHAQSVAKASLAAKNNRLEVAVSSPGTEGWHLQLSRNNLSLSQGEMYRISFTVSATQPCSFTQYIGRNADPWDAYGDYRSYTIPAETRSFSYLFTMKEASDPVARIVFDLGTLPASTTFSLHDLKLEKITYHPVANISVGKGENATFYFDRDQHTLSILNHAGYEKATAYSLSGRFVSRHSLYSGLNPIETYSWQPGVYFVFLEGKAGGHTLKVLKSRGH